MKHTKLLCSLILLAACCLQAYAKDCPVTGGSSNGKPLTAKKQDLNTKKNRAKDPVESNIDPNVTINKMLNSGDEPNAFDESKAATITGYMFKAKDEPGESCNCYATDAAQPARSELIRRIKIIFLFNDFLNRNIKSFCDRCNPLYHYFIDGISEIIIVKDLHKTEYRRYGPSYVMSLHI